MTSAFFCTEKPFRFPDENIKSPIVDYKTLLISQEVLAENISIDISRITFLVAQ